MSANFESWAQTQLAKLLPLDGETLRQIIDHANSLPKEAASENLKSLLGDSPQAFEFISSFNLRRPSPSSTSENTNHHTTTPDTSISEVPRASPKPRKKKAQIHTPAARQIQAQGASQGAYKKQDEEDYMPTRNRQRHTEQVADTLALQPDPDARQAPVPSRPSPKSDAAPATTSHLKLPPSASGPLISDSARSSRSSSPAKRSTGGASKTKVNVTGGTSMRGASTTLSELDSAIRSLELQTDPTVVSADTPKRRCHCQAQRHALLAAAPNCLSCGKIICAKEGLGPCTFCGAPPLSRAEIQEMLRLLKEERGKERQNEHNIAHKKAEVSKAPRSFASSHTAPASSVPASGAASGATSDSEGPTDKSLSIAKAHRDRLLKFQSENAKRTQIHDEAADFETPDVGTSMWASPLERAQQLKRQQKILRQQEWNAKQDFEKRQMVMSIDVKGGKAVRRMQEVSYQDVQDDLENEDDVAAMDDDRSIEGAGFARNPLLGELIRPVYSVVEDGKGKSKAREKANAWRRVQDDNDDNEQWILDGGAYGDNNMTVLSTQEPVPG